MGWGGVSIPCVVVSRALVQCGEVQRWMDRFVKRRLLITARMSVQRIGEERRVLEEVCV